MLIIESFVQSLARQRAAFVQFIARQRAAHRDKFRVFSMLLAFAVFMAVVQQLNPAKGVLILWFLTKVTLAFYIGYWGDRIINWYSRPHTLEGIARGAAEKRRATLIFGCLVVAAFVP